jgi:hypothetical protein
MCGQHIGLIGSFFILARSPGQSKTGFEQVKIMKEFVSINRKFF